MMQFKFFISFLKIKFCSHALLEECTPLEPKSLANGDLDSLKLTPKHAKKENLILVSNSQTRVIKLHQDPEWLGLGSKRHA